MVRILLTIVLVRADTLVTKPASAMPPTSCAPRADPIQRIPPAAEPSLTPGVGALL